MSVYADEHYKVYTEIPRRARKEHACCACELAFWLPGEPLAHHHPADTRDSRCGLRQDYPRCYQRRAHGDGLAIINRRRDDASATNPCTQETPMAKPIKVHIEYKNPDLTSELMEAGMTPAAALKVSRKAAFGEYFVFEISFEPESGRVTGCRQVKVEQ